MKPTKSIKVLIALDYDKTAIKVAETGYAMAKSMNAEVTLLHVMSDPLYYASTEYSPIMGLTDSMGVDPLQFDSDDRLKKVSQHFLEKIKHHLGDESIITDLEEGDFADTILIKQKVQVLIFWSWVLTAIAGSKTWCLEVSRKKLFVTLLSRFTLFRLKSAIKYWSFNIKKCGSPNQ